MGNRWCKNLWLSIVIDFQYASIVYHRLVSIFIDSHRLASVGKVMWSVRICEWPVALFVLFILGAKWITYFFEQRAVKSRVGTTQPLRQTGFRYANFSVGSVTCHWSEIRYLLTSPERCDHEWWNISNTVRQPPLNVYRTSPGMSMAATRAATLQQPHRLMRVNLIPNERNSLCCFLFAKLWALRF